jgi:hypothetical protein
MHADVCVEHNRNLSLHYGDRAFGGLLTSGPSDEHHPGIFGEDFRISGDKFTERMDCGWSATAEKELHH